MLQSGGRIQPPPGMSLQAMEVKSNLPTLQQQYNFSQQQLISLQQNDRPLNAVVPQQQNSNMKQHLETPDSATDNIDKKFREITLSSGIGKGNIATVSGASPNFGGFLEDDEDDELPPPPPVLSSHTIMGAVNSGNILIFSKTLKL